MLTNDVRIELLPATVETLQAYGVVPMTFEVSSVLRVEPVDGGLGGVRFVEEPVVPYTKSWDEAPETWATRWDTSGWAVLAAYVGDARVGGAVVATHTGDMWFLRRRTDTVALWDLRVDAESRGRGVGHALFGRAVEWARERGFRRLMIECQNTNVAACRFYARQGCYLGAFEMHAYETSRTTSS